MSHWYETDGSPAYKVAKKDGTLRDTNMRDARKLKLKPSVTTVIAVRERTGLHVWLEQQILIAASLHYYTPGDDIKKWAKQVMFLSKQVGRNAAQKGNEVHDSLERYYKGEPRSEADAQYEQIIKNVSEFLSERFGEREWVAEASFCRDGYGGKVDLHSLDGEIIIDFKTKNTVDLKKMLANDDYCMQLAAYKHGLNKPNAICYNLFISVAKENLLVLAEYTEEDIQRGLAMFQTLHNFWRLANKFKG